MSRSSTVLLEISVEKMLGVDPADAASDSPERSVINRSDLLAGKVIDFEEMINTGLEAFAFVIKIVSQMQRV